MSDCDSCTFFGPECIIHSRSGSQIEFGGQMSPLFCVVVKFESSKFQREITAEKKRRFWRQLMN